MAFRSLAQRTIVGAIVVLLAIAILFMGSPQSAASKALRENRRRRDLISISDIRKRRQSNGYEGIEHQGDGGGGDE